MQTAVLPDCYTYSYCPVIDMFLAIISLKRLTSLLNYSHSHVFQKLFEGTPCFWGLLWLAGYLACNQPPIKIYWQGEWTNMFLCSDGSFDHRDSFGVRDQNTNWMTHTASCILRLCGIQPLLHQGTCGLSCTESHWALHDLGKEENGTLQESLPFCPF